MEKNPNSGKVSNIRYLNADIGIAMQVLNTVLYAANWWWAF
jgi:hypothetical protein